MPSFSAATATRPVDAIVFTPPEAGKIPPPPDTPHRAVHQIRLSSISHNYTCVEVAAAQQRCSVIVVVKADGYGHGAVETALHLADHVGADAFAVATLEEGIALRKAFDSTPSSVRHMATPQISGGGESRSTSSSSSPVSTQPVRSMRSPQIRILVLGPPVGYPRCFDEYFHYGIEVMCSGPEVAKAMIEWVSDERSRKRTQVERAANDAKQAALLLSRTHSRDGVNLPPKNMFVDPPPNDKYTTNTGAPNENSIPPPLVNVYYNF
jgi:Alanine racemase, N-terminal domain